MRDAYRQIIQRLMQIPKPTIKDLNLIKMQAAQEFNLQTLPPNSILIRNLKATEKSLLPLLRRKHVRTISGVTRALSVDPENSIAEILSQFAHTRMKPYFFAKPLRQERLPNLGERKLYIDALEM